MTELTRSQRIRVHKIRLEPNNVQRSHLEQCAGSSRFAYNWGLAHWNQWYEEYKNGKRDEVPTDRRVRKEFNALKRKEFPWFMDMSKCIPQESFSDLGRAFKNFYTKKGKYPRFKKKGFCKDSFRITGDHVRILTYGIEQPDGTVTSQRSYVRFAKAPGEYKLSEHLRYNGRILNVTFSRTGKHWYASFVIELEEDDKELQPIELDPLRPRLGIDLGLHEFVCSDGMISTVPRVYRRNERRLRRKQQALSRKQKGSKNRAQALREVSHLQAKTAAIRRDWLHKLSTTLVRQNSVIVLEDLNVKGMMQSRLAKSVNDAGFAEFRRQVKYKINRYKDRELVIADRWFPSSKLCSACGAKATSMPLHIRAWTCESCGSQHHRDLNAAINLANYNLPGVPRCQSVDSSEPLPQRVVESPVVASTLNEAETKRHSVKNE